MEYETEIGSGCVLDNRSMDSRKLCLKVGKTSVCLVGRIMYTAKPFSEHPQCVITDQLANIGLYLIIEMFFVHRHYLHVLYRVYSSNAFHILLFYLFQDRT